MRFWRLRSCTLVVLLFALSGGAAFADKRVALIIGNSAYKRVVRLPNPVNDAAAVAAMFTSAGFDTVVSKFDLTNTDMHGAVREFTGVAREADIAVVYYSGHGIEIRGKNYLVPVDARLASDLDVEDETISFDHIMDMLESVKRLRLIILDACRVNPFGKTRSIGRGLATFVPPTGDTLIAYAASSGNISSDGDGDHSPFTFALLHNIAAPGVDLRIAFGKVRDEVLKSTNGLQTPFTTGYLSDPGATIALVPVSAPVPAAEPPRRREQQ